MEKIPTVTAIIIFYNTEKYLAEAIKSILCQSCSDLEILLVDDGSTDKSTAIAQRYAGENPALIHYLEHENHANLGMSAARNLGIRAARGKYIAFLDADDTWPAGRLERMLGIYEAHPELGMVFGRLNFFSDADDIIPITEPSKLFLPTNQVLFPPTALKERFRFSSELPTTFSNIVTTQKVLLDTGGFVNEFRGMGEDVVAWVKINLHYPVYALDEWTLNYRRHPTASGVVDDREGKFRAGNLRIARWVYEYVKKENEETRAWALPVIMDALLYAILVSGFKHAPDKPFFMNIPHNFPDYLRTVLTYRKEYPEIFNVARVLSVLTYLINNKIIRI